MPAFAYRAIDGSGSIVEGTLDAASERALEVQLRQASKELLSCKARKSGGIRRRRAISGKELIGFCFHLEQVTQAGLPLLEALEDLRDSVANPQFREILSNVHSSVESGKTLSQALSQFPETFDEVFINLISVGEESGELAAVLEKVTESLKWQDELRAKAKSIVIYPAFVSLVVLAVLMFMMLYVVPQMVDFIKEMGESLPIHTRALIGFSNLMVNHWYWIIPLPPAILMLIRIQARRSESLRLRVDGWKLNMWLLGPIFSKLILSRFASYFALMYSAGLDVLESLRISEDIVGNAVIRKSLRQIGASIADGNSLSASIKATGLFPPLVIRMVSMGEQTGRLDSALANVSYFYDREVSEAIERLQAMIEPAMTVILGALMGWVMLSVLGPIYDTISKIGV